MAFSGTTDLTDDTDQLGQILLARGLVTAEQLGSALASQKLTYAPLGQILVREGMLDSRALQDALGRQSTLRESFYRLGDLLLHMGLVSDETLAWALREQHNSGALMGKVLVDAGLLAARDLWRALALQSELRRRLLSAALAITMAIQPLAATAAEIMDQDATAQVVELAVHVPDAMNVSEGLMLGLPGMRGIDRIRLLQPLLPYAQDADTIIITARPEGAHGDEFVLSGPGRTPIPVELRLMLDPTQEMVELKAGLAAQVPTRTSVNSHMLEISFDRPSFESLSQGDYMSRIQLVVTPL